MSPSDLVNKLIFTIDFAKSYIGFHGFLKFVFKPWETHSAKLAVWLDILQANEFYDIFTLSKDKYDLKELDHTRIELFDTYSKMWGKPPRIRK